MTRFIPQDIQQNLRLRHLKARTSLVNTQMRSWKKSALQTLGLCNSLVRRICLCQIPTPHPSEHFQKQSRNRHSQGGIMPNTRGITLHLLLWVVQLLLLSLCSKFDSTVESSQLLSLATGFLSPLQSDFFVSRQHEVEQQFSGSYKLFKIYNTTAWRH